MVVPVAAVSYHFLCPLSIPTAVDKDQHILTTILSSKLGKLVSISDLKQYLFLISIFFCQGFLYCMDFEFEPHLRRIFVSFYIKLKQDTKIHYLFYKNFPVFMY